MIAKVTVAEIVKEMRLHGFVVTETKARKLISRLIACGYFRQISDDEFMPMMRDDNDPDELQSDIEACLAGYLWCRAEEHARRWGSARPLWQS
jgi:hypothetical protein